MIRHLKMKLSFLTLILISSIVFATDEITISKAFIKMPRPGVDVTAGFATIKADIDLKVMKVSNKNFKNIELHSMKMTYGVMEMRKLVEPKIGPNSPLVLSPGNDHLMLFGINEKLKSGENLDLTFVFKDSKDNKITKVFKFVVK
ncbi:copper chaperone PCu(A)C [Methylophilaceae bacterium]|nr:copper chaperone PCu(A)C [Methylophilaceae bacterium]